MRTIDELRQEIGKSSNISATDWADFSEKCYRAERYHDALLCCEQALALDPNQARANRIIGHIYSVGHTGVTDLQKAIEHYSLAVTNGIEQAKQDLIDTVNMLHKNKTDRDWHLVGFRYAEGDGCKKDYFVAFICFEQASLVESHHRIPTWDSRVHYVLGEFYRYGWGVAKDLEMAKTHLLQCELDVLEPYVAEVLESVLEELEEASAPFEDLDDFDELPNSSSGNSQIVPANANAAITEEQWFAKLKNYGAGYVPEINIRRVVYGVASGLVGISVVWKISGQLSREHFLIRLSSKCVPDFITKSATWLGSNYYVQTYVLKYANEYVFQYVRGITPLTVAFTGGALGVGAAASQLVSNRERQELIDQHNEKMAQRDTNIAGLTKSFDAADNQIKELNAQVNQAKNTAQTRTTNEQHLLDENGELKDRVQEVEVENSNLRAKVNNVTNNNAAPARNAGRAPKGTPAATQNATQQQAQSSNAGNNAAGFFAGSAAKSGSQQASNPGGQPTSSPKSTK